MRNDKKIPDIYNIFTQIGTKSEGRSLRGNLIAAVLLPQAPSRLFTSQFSAFRTCREQKGGVFCFTEHGSNLRRTTYMARYYHLQ
jgi:hypothetical protein